MTEEFKLMFGNNGSRIASLIISFLPVSRWHTFKRWLLLKIGGIEIGERTTIFSGARFVGKYIKIGSDCHIGSGCFICATTPHAWITIGDWCSLGPEVFMTTGSHDVALGDSHRTNGVSMPITIGSRCGLSVRCMIMAGISIGDGSLISPGVVVSRNIAPYTLVAPASIRRMSLKA